MSFFVRAVSCFSLAALIFTLSPEDCRALDDPNDGFVMCLEQQYQFSTVAGTDCWGWQAPDGREYAFMGIINGIVCVNVTDHDIVDTIIGPQNGCGNTRWRDIKHYQNYLYAVSECTGTNQGMMIIDMSFLPDSLHFVRSYTTGSDITSHNLNIDTVKGYAYLVKQNYSGFRVISLANPVFPTEHPFVPTGDIHDVFAYNDTVWVAEGSFSTFSVWNMANKNAAQFIARTSFPDGGYVHNIWPSDDRNYVATSQETDNRTVKIWDISNYANIQLVGNYLAPSGLVHNVHWQGDKFYMSHYESGVAVININNPASPQEVARYDTWPTENPDFNGCWGVFPHTQSGRVYASNLDGKLFIFTSGTVDVASDALSGNTVLTAPSAKPFVTASLNNGGDINEVILPLDYNGPFNLQFDSISTVGLRTNGWSKERLILGSPGSKREVWRIFGPQIGAGSGPVAKVFFRTSSLAPAGDSNFVKFDAVLLTSPAEGITNCYNHVLPTSPALMKIPPPSGCCIASTGNVDNSPEDGVDIGDLTVLVDHLFITFAALACDGEANIDGSISPTPDIGDLTALVDHLFIAFAPTAACQ